MTRKVIALFICAFVFTIVLAGCVSNSNSTASPSPSTAAVTNSASPSVSASSSPEPSVSSSPIVSSSPSPSVSPDGFVMGKVTAVNGQIITLTVVTHAADSSAALESVKTIMADNNTSITISGSLKSAAITDIAVGDVITSTLKGTTALRIIDDGPNVNPDPSAYMVSPSPSASASPSPAAS